MEQAYPDISDELREQLQQRGIRPYKPQPLVQFLNPYHSTYWQTNLLLLAFCWYQRKQATKIGSPRVFWSTAMCSIPFYALMSKGKLESQDDILGKRKTFEERLEYSPVTRRAWEKAIDINTDYQNQLREEIAELEARLYLKNKSA